jgi:spermidine/putrescine transport system ATP-binding protein
VTKAAPDAVAAGGAVSSPSPPVLSVRQVIKRFGQRPVLCGISLDVASGEFLTILGESGSGKTTLLRLIAGFEDLDSGEIWMGAERLDRIPAHRRQVNTVFQSYALFPHLSVFENVAYGLRAKNTAKSEIPERVTKALAMVKMGEFAQAAPATLSGGQQQRVALARALANRPRVLLLDEPLSALDANLRRQMQVELKSLQREVGITFIFVTHDQEEAMALSDRVALLRAGHLEQVAPPREIYGEPETAYAAQFIGQTNLLRAEVRDGVASAGSIAWHTFGATGKATYSLRPECIRLVNESAELPVAAVDVSSARFRGRVRNQAFGGAMDSIEIDCGGLNSIRARIANPGILTGEHEFEFAAKDAVRVREGEPD